MRSVTTDPAGPSKVLMILAFAAIYILWGSTYLAIRAVVVTGVVLIHREQGRISRQPVARQSANRKDDISATSQVDLTISHRVGGDVHIGCESASAWRFPRGRR